MKLFGLRLNQVVFMIAALGILVSLPWLSAWGAWLWVASGILFLVGIILVLFNK